MMQGLIVTMIENIVVFTYSEYFSTMTWPEELITLITVDDGCSIALGHGFTFAINEFTRQFAASAHL